MQRGKDFDVSCCFQELGLADLNADVLRKPASATGRCRELTASDMCSKSDGDLTTLATDANSQAKKDTRKKSPVSLLTPEVLVTYARELEERKSYEEQYRTAALGAFGTARSLGHLYVPTVLKTDKEAVFRQYQSDPCIAGLGILH